MGHYWCKLELKISVNAKVVDMSQKQFSFFLSHTVAKNLSLRRILAAKGSTIWDILTTGIVRRYNVFA